MITIGLFLSSQNLKDYFCISLKVFQKNRLETLQNMLYLIGEK